MIKITAKEFCDLHPEIVDEVFLRWCLGFGGDTINDKSEDDWVELLDRCIDEYEDRNSASQ